MLQRNVFWVSVLPSGDEYITLQAVGHPVMQEFRNHLFKSIHNLAFVQFVVSCLITIFNNKTFLCLSLFFYAAG